MVGEHVSFVERSVVNDQHARSRAAAVSHLRSRQVPGARRQSDHYENQLNDDIDRLFHSYVRRNSAKVIVVVFFSGPI